MGYNIRCMEEKDFDLVYALGIKDPKNNVAKRETFWPKDTLKKWIKASYDSKDVMLVAETENGKFAGYLTSIYHEPTGKAIIENLDMVAEYKIDKLSLEKSLLQEGENRLFENGASFVNVFKADTDMIELLKEQNYKPAENVISEDGYKVGKPHIWYIKNRGMWLREKKSKK